MNLDERASPEPGPFLLGMPSAPHFRVSPAIMVAQLWLYLGISPTPTDNWVHQCVKGKDLMPGSHVYHCSQQGRAIRVHGELFEQLRIILGAAGYGHG